MAKKKKPIVVADIVVKRLKYLNSDKEAIIEAKEKATTPQQIEYLEKKYDNILDEIKRQLDYAAQADKSNPTRLILPDDVPHESSNGLIKLQPTVFNDRKSRKSRKKA